MLSVDCVINKMLVKYLSLDVSISKFSFLQENPKQMRLVSEPSIIRAALYPSNKSH